MLKKNFSILFIVFLFSISALAQSNTGKVTEIVNGRTVVIASDAGQKTTLMLLYIEVPEPEQLLSKAVKEHLEKLVLNKTVRFFPQYSYSKGVIGKLYLGDVEMNLQMLRDGAAWYDFPEYGNNNSEYQKMENLARNEKLGVWGVAGLKPAWEFREQQYAKQLASKKAALKPAPETQMWAAVPDNTGGKGYKTFYDKFPNVTQFVTDLMPVSIKRFQESFSMSFYVQESFYGQQLSKDTKFSYFISFKAKGGLVLFDYSSDLRLVCGQERIHLDRPEYQYDIKGSLYDENNPRTEFASSRFQMTEEEFKIFKGAKEVEFKLGTYEGTISEGQMNAVRDLPKN